VLGDNNAIQAKHIKEDLLAPHDSGVAQLAVKDQNEVRGELGTPTTTDKVDREFLVRQKLLADCVLEPAHQRHGVCVLGINTGQAQRGGVADNHILGRRDGLGGQQLGGHRELGQCVDVSDIGGDDRILRGRSFHVGAKAVTIDLAKHLFGQLLKVSLCEVSGDGRKKQRKRRSGGGGQGQVSVLA